MVKEINPKATGRNGQDEIWELAHNSLLAGKWGIACEAIATLNVFFKSYAVDCLLTMHELKNNKVYNLTMPPTKLMNMIDKEIREWNQAVISKLKLD